MRDLDSELWSLGLSAGEYVYFDGSKFVGATPSSSNLANANLTADDLARTYSLNTDDATSSLQFQRNNGNPILAMEGDGVMAIGQSAVASTKLVLKNDIGTTTILNVKNSANTSIMDISEAGVFSTTTGLDRQLSGAGTHKTVMGGALSTDEYAIRDSADNYSIMSVLGDGTVDFTLNGATYPFFSTLNNGTLGNQRGSTASNAWFGGGAGAQLYATGTGFQNALFGANAGVSLTGAYNVFMGYLAGGTATSVQLNTGIGHRALNSVVTTTANNNTAVGGSSLRYLTGGTGNVAVGNTAGQTLGVGGNHTSASSSVFIGQGTKPANNGETNQIVIGDSAVGNGSNTVTIGNSSITDTYLRNATIYAEGALSTDGALTVRNSADTATIFYVNGEGEVNANGATGQASITSIGAGAFSQATRTTALNNTAIGNGALRLATSGGENTAIGSQSMYDLTSGLNSTAVGYQSLANVTGSNSHTAIGYQALVNLGATTGANNVGIGKQAGAYHTSGATALTQATNSVFIGTVARASGNAVTNEIVIGVSALGNGSNTATIGTSATTNLHVGTTLNLYQETTGVTASTFTANTSGISDDTATWDGYTIGQVVKSLRNLGLLA